MVRFVLRCLLLGLALEGATAQFGKRNKQKQEATPGLGDMNDVDRAMGAWEALSKNPNMIGVCTTRLPCPTGATTSCEHP